MKLCRVFDPVVSTVKHRTYEGQSLFVVRRVDAALKETGEEFLAVDRVQAGEGDLVLVMQEGNGVRQLFGETKLPIRSIIVGIVDSVTTNA
jgi:microcompartment protein CcmK/EutM